MEFLPSLGRVFHRLMPSLMKIGRLEISRRYMMYDPVIARNRVRVGEKLCYKVFYLEREG